MSDPNNRLVPHLVEYVLAIFRDGAHLYTRPSDCERDQTRLIYELAERGLRTVTIDLPAVGKHFDKCLAGGLFLPFDGIFMRPKKKGEKIPVFMRDLLKQIFSPVDGVLRSDPPVEVIAFVRQVLHGAKKLSLPCPERAINAEVANFRAIEAEVRAPSLKWECDTPLSADPAICNSSSRVHLSDGLDRSTADPQLDIFQGKPESERLSLGDIALLQRVFDVVASNLGDFSDEESAIPKHGPGVVADLRKTRTSKYEFASWPSKLEHLYPWDHYATHDYGGLGNLGDMKAPTDVEHPSRLISVPKTMKGPRLIAAEPSYHQWIQQLLWKQLEVRIARSRISACVSFRSQRRNQAMAIAGSREGKYTTVDLSSASDRLSCWLVERFCRSNWTLLDRLHACRTRSISNSINPLLWETIQLKKFSTMGSACIFPMQTIIYASIAIASVIASRGLHFSDIEEASHQCSIFGDDIVIPTDSWCKLEAYLKFAGLVVNRDKTFTTGRFRESCGVDAFAGYDVSPAYLREKPEARPSATTSLVETSNNFHGKGYWHVAAWLQTFMADVNHLIPIVPSRSGQFGYKSFVGGSLSHLKSRWDANSQQPAYRILMIRKKNEIRRSEPRHSFMQWITESPASDLPWEAGYICASVDICRPGWALEMELCEEPRSSRES